ncbi:MAG: SDR family NAD(P)-dependent oxidoreductase [Bacteroidales bacterium]
MKHINYIFSGFGYSHGKYKISNKDIQDAISKSFLTGFKEDRISESENFLKYKANNPDARAFDYFVTEIMGFYERYHVSPFPPTRKKLFYSETSLDLAVKAVENCLIDAKIKAEEIDAWFVSTVSPQQKAPGIAANVKAFFVEISNYTPAFSLQSGCAGFLLNLQRAIEWLNSHPEAKNVVIAHSETMSSFLTQRIKFVPFVTFGDAAAAVVLTKIESEEKFGIIYLNNYQDQYMLDFVGVDKNKNLYMDDLLIKDRAIKNITDSVVDCLKATNHKIEDISFFVPHQTGNAIIFPIAKHFSIPKEKIILYGQHKYGNVSGATIPITLALLQENNELYDGSKILCATAGVGGNFGAFLYSHKITEKPKEFYLYENDFKNKTCLVLGASGHIGSQLAIELQKRGADLILQYNSAPHKIEIFKNHIQLKCDLKKETDVDKFINHLQNLNSKIDYVFNLAGTTEANDSMQVNFYSPIKIFNNLISKIKSAIIQLGNSSEDFASNDCYEWAASKRALHGYLASASGEFLKYGIKIIYIQSGFTNQGIFTKLPEKYIFKTMLLSGQDDSIKTDILVNKIVNSPYKSKVLGMRSSYENAMLLYRYGYHQDVDI